MEPVTSTSLAGVCIVCGPPGSGKTTFVQQHMRPGDIVLDMDTIVSARPAASRHIPIIPASWTRLYL